MKAARFALSAVILFIAGALIRALLPSDWEDEEAEERHEVDLVVDQDDDAET